MNRATTILLTAAEASGDALAAGLIQALRKRLPAARFVGIGGERMAEAGCELLGEPVGRAAMLVGSLRQLFYYAGLTRKVARAMSELRPAVHVPVDSPALNWHLARAARRRGIPVMYYVAPQVWAWAPWRTGKLRRLTDAVACILPFEPDYLRPRGVNARFVGHPVFDELPPADPPDLAAASAKGTWRIALLPGSRRAEIQAHTPALVTVADTLRRRFPRCTLTFSALNGPAAAVIRDCAGRDDLNLEVGRAAGLLARSDFALVASGTATLEVAHYGVPMVVFYRASRFLHRLLKGWMIRTKNLSLVNILAGARIVPELMPWSGDAEELLGRAEAMLQDLAGLQAVQGELLRLVQPLRPSSGVRAADSAAELVIQTMARRE